MEKLPEKYTFTEYEKGDDLEKWMLDFQIWLEKILKDMAYRINWLIDNI